MDFLIFCALVALLWLLFTMRSAMGDLVLRFSAIEAKLATLVAAPATSQARKASEAPAAPADPAPADPARESLASAAADLVRPPPEAAPPPATLSQPLEAVVPERRPAEPVTEPPVTEAALPPPPAPEAVAAAEPPAPPPPPPPPPRQPPTVGSDLADLEKRFGTQWVVWVGGIALALGGIFLIRYSIERGYFGPGTRVLLGALLAFALVAAGEWTRRQELRLGIAEAATAHIPSILTAAGTTVAYATVYGAHALYGFLSAGLAFTLLGAVALASLAAALVHGPALAGLGLIGAYVTPMLISTTRPNYWVLYVYLIVVTAAALALARARLWRWLAIAAMAFGLFWSFVGINDQSTTAISAHAFYFAASFALAAVFIVAGFLFGPPNEDDGIDLVSSAALAGGVFAAFVLALESDHDLIALATFSVLVAATVAIALRTAAPTLAMVIAAAFATLVIIDWAVSGYFLYRVRHDAGNPDRGRRHAPHFGCGLRGVVRRGRRPCARTLRTAGYSDAVGSDRRARADPHPDCGLLSDLGVSAVDPVCRRGSAHGRALRVCDGSPVEARAAPGSRRRGRRHRHRRARGAGARADHRARQGLAHGRAQPDGAGHRVRSRPGGRCPFCVGPRLPSSWSCLRASPGIRASSATTLGRPRS